MHLLNCNEPSARAVGRFTQHAEIPVPAQRFGGIVEGVVLAVGERRHRGSMRFILILGPRAKG